LDAVDAAASARTSCPSRDVASRRCVENSTRFGFGDAWTGTGLAVAGASVGAGVGVEPQATTARQATVSATTRNWRNSAADHVREATTGDTSGRRTRFRPA
jgi:hypothetical protein